MTPNHEITTDIRDLATRADDPETLRRLINISCDCIDQYGDLLDRQRQFLSDQCDKLESPPLTQNICWDCQTAESPALAEGPDGYHYCNDCWSQLFAFDNNNKVVRRSC